MPAEIIVSRFSQATLGDLERNHAVVLDPLNTSLAELVKRRRPLGLIVNRGNPDFMGLRSRSSQVAFFPDSTQLYVPESNLKSLVRHRACLEVDAAEVLNNNNHMGIGGVDWIIGDVATHAGLVLALFSRTKGKVRLHGEKYDFRSVRTETLARTEIPTGRFIDVGVGRFSNYGLDVIEWFRDLGYNDLWVARLGVPAEE